MSESFEDMEQRAHCGQWDFETLLRWYYDAKQELAAKEKELAELSDRFDDARKLMKIMATEATRRDKELAELRETVTQRHQEWQGLVRAILPPRPMCRDCADHDGTCDDGLPCDPTERAIQELAKLRRDRERLDKCESLLEHGWDIAGDGSNIVIERMDSPIYVRKTLRQAIDEAIKHHEK